MESDPKFDSLKPLLASAGWKGDFKIIPLPRVGNNRAFRIHGEKQDLFLKAYFHDPEDRRNRLETEFSFVRFVWDKGIRSVPRPLTYDSVNKLGLYEFIEGTPLIAKDIGPAEMDQAVGFFQSVNEHKRSNEAKKISTASEAAFSLKDQLETVRTRFEAFGKIDSASSRFHKEARQFIESELRPAWDEVSKFVLKEAKGAHVDEALVLADEDRCLSPSDFGFHNTLRVKGGDLKFFDFEYAGWDDPAKMVSDFFHQPRLSVPPSLMPSFVDKITARFRDPSFQRIKIALVRPLFGLKWSCIMLNDFLPAGERKLRFSVGAEGSEARWEERLKKSRAQLKRIFPLDMDLNDWN